MLATMLQRGFENYQHIDWNCDHYYRMETKPQLENAKKNKHVLKPMLAILTLIWRPGFTGPRSVHHISIKAIILRIIL